MRQGQGHSPSARARSARPVLIGLAALGLALFVLPLLGLVIRALTEASGLALLEPAVRSALLLSLLVSTAATALAFVLGFPLAWVLARLDFPGRRLVRAAVTLPMVLPPVVAGVALLSVFGRRGVLGPALSAMGIELAFTPAAAVLAATFVAAPFLIVTLEAALEAMDPRLEQAAATLGASEWRILWTVTLPTIRPAVLAGLALSWARALGEFGATITFAGNVSGRTQTLPLAVYETLQSDFEGALQLSVVLLVVSLSVLVGLRGHFLGAPAEAQR
ncbi:putative ABC transporter permease protein [Plesiocystis pacifica SIR-1]|uniref:Molybdenum transport system permease n=1 Tax=Plesiocystis pacifica SIR-1 TaxID=391625 RepID=A6GF41_9BACT|nr:ABC transporter permease [Plesiocystis pacifica]EDM75500.1 putative ABC transporter permease protein [Plesiocystis pacifica SIR-1]